MTHPRLALARGLHAELFTLQWVNLCESNRPIFELLDDGGESDYYPLPGADLDAVRENLRRALALAAEPVPPVTAGHDREQRTHQARRQREALHLFTRVALALLEGASGPDGVQTMDATSASMDRATRTHGAHQEQAEQARQAAQRRLSAAAQFAALPGTAKPLFSKQMGRGRQAQLVRMEWPGVLAVYDPDTGRTLARSKPGQPDTLAPDFDALPRNGGHA